MGRMRLAGLGVVALAVLVLAGSLVLGLGGGEGGGAGRDGSPADTARERIRVEVLNAGRIPGAARAATDSLRGHGFDVVYFGNASGFGPDTSWVLDRLDRAGPAEAVAEALGIEHVLTRVDTTLYVDVSVILGRDWPERAEEAADTAG